MRQPIRLGLAERVLERAEQRVAHDGSARHVHATSRRSARKPASIAASRTCIRRRRASTRSRAGSTPRSCGASSAHRPRSPPQPRRGVSVTSRRTQDSSAPPVRGAEPPARRRTAEPGRRERHVVLVGELAQLGSEPLLREPAERHEALREIAEDERAPRLGLRPRAACRARPASRRRGRPRRRPRSRAGRGRPTASGPPPVSITPTGVARCAPRSERAERARRDPAADGRVAEALRPVRAPRARGRAAAASSAGPEIPGSTITRRLTGSTSSTRASARRSSTAERRAVAAVVGVDPAREARAAAARHECHVVLGAGRDKRGDALGIVRAQHEVGRRDRVAATAAHDIGIRGPRGAARAVPRDRRRPRHAARARSARAPAARAREVARRAPAGRQAAAPEARRARGAAPAASPRRWSPRMAAPHRSPTRACPPAPLWARHRTSHRRIGTCPAGIRRASSEF